MARTDLENEISSSISKVATAIHAREFGENLRDKELVLPELELALVLLPTIMVSQTQTQSRCWINRKMINLNNDVLSIATLVP